MPLRIDREYLYQTLADLIRIDSINPSLVSGGRGEAEIAAYVSAALRRLNLDVTTHEAAPGRVSVVGILRGRGGRHSLMFNAHLDTVGVEGMPEPFSAAIRDARMYGRGAYDMKGSLAACLAAVKALTDAQVALSSDLLVAAVADEEYASIGTANLIQHYPVEAAVVTEPTELDLCLAHKGFIWLEVETTGRAAHGSRFDLGIDANMHMGRFLAELDQLEQELRARPGHPLVGPASLHAAMIQGGSGLSTYAASCKLAIERRTIPGETQDQVLAEVEAIVRKLSAAERTFNAVVRRLLARDPFEVPAGARIVKAVRQAATQVLGREPPLAGRNPWTDAALLSAAGVETVVMGPVGNGAHSAEEWVDLESVAALAQILAQTARDYCA